MSSRPDGAPRGHIPRTLVLVVLLATGAAGPVRASDGIELAGDILAFALPAASYGMTGCRQDGAGAAQYTKALALTLAVTHTLKYTIDAERPDGGSQSFPSSHASVSFSAAEFARGRYGWEYGAPLYAAAAFVAYSRVEAGRHYVRDVVAGGVIGIAGSHLFTSPFHGWHIRVQAADGRYGLVASRRW